MTTLLQQTLQRIKDAAEKDMAVVAAGKWDIYSVERIAELINSLGYRAETHVSVLGFCAQSRLGFSIFLTATPQQCADLLELLQMKKIYATRRDTNITAYDAVYDLNAYDSFSITLYRREPLFPPERFTCEERKVAA